MMKTYTFENSSTITLDFENARIVSICMENEELIAGDNCFFALKLRDKKGNHKIIDGSECSFVSFRGEAAHYTHEEIEVDIKIRQEGNRLIWRMDVENKTDKLIEWAEIMSTGVGGRLMDEAGGKGEILFPWNEGCVVRDMHKRNTNPFPYIEPEYPSLGKYAIFPNMVSSQFLAYVANGRGIYLGMHDRGRTTKHIDFRTVGESIRLQMRAFCDVSYGESYRMPFDSVLELYSGDWHDGAEIYRSWFYENLPEGLEKISESQSLPEWYGKSPIVVAYPVRGRFDTDVMEPNCYYPYENAIPYLREIADRTESPVMPLLMHWEGSAPWAPPYVWPPYGGEEVFQRFVEKAHGENMYVGLYCSGMGWTQQSNFIAEYNREQEFKAKKLSRIMCSDTDGTLKSAICKEQREGYDLCPACEESQKILTDALSPVTASGIDYLQVLDQNHGGCSYFCYSDSHGHNPAPGKWQAEQTNELLKKIAGNGVLIGCESAAAEPFLTKLKFSDNRYELTHYIGYSVPLYSYLYHEYVNNFMGNQICMFLTMEKYNYPYRLAYSFIAGDMLTVVFGENGQISYAWGNDCFKYHTDKTAACELLKNLNGWRQKGGRDHLHMGKMVKPMAIHCGTNGFKGEDGRPFIVDEVLTAAYEYGGKTLQFAVNYNSQPVTVFVDEPVTVYLDSDLQAVYNDVTKITIPPLTAVAIERG